MRLYTVSRFCSICWLQYFGYFVTLHILKVTLTKRYFRNYERVHPESTFDYGITCADIYYCCAYIRTEGQYETYGNLVILFVGTYTEVAT